MYEELKARLQAKKRNATEEEDDALEAIEQLERQLAERDAEIAKFRAAAPQPEPVDIWQPIDTAPKDGSCVLLRATIGTMLAPHSKTVVGIYSRGWWLEGSKINLSHVTHWMPIPKPPAMSQGEQK